MSVGPPTNATAWSATSSPGVAAHPDELLDELGSDARPVASGLFQAVRLLNRVPVAEADAFKYALLVQIGARLARARGPYGRAFGREDADTLQLIASLLSIETDYSTDELLAAAA